MAAGSDTELQKLRELLRRAEERAGQAEGRVRDEQASRLRAEGRVRDEQASRLRAEERARDEQENRLRAERQVQEEQRRNENTTFRDFLKLCHFVLFRPLQAQADKTLTTKGSITNPRGRKCPTFLRPWDDFPAAHLQYFDEVYRLFHSAPSDHPKLFSPAIALEDLGRLLSRRPLASEKDLESYQRFAVEERVVDVISQLLNMPQARQSFALGNGVEFENHANTLSDNAEEVLQRTQQRSRTDQICVYRSLEDRRSLSFIIEYKPPHKLSVEYLRAGLRPMNLWEDVVQRRTIPNDPGEKLNYNADRLTGAAITQTFEYMIENGLEYSYMTNGEAFIFLRVRENDPTTVYYYLAEPNREADEQYSTGFRYPFTAVGRVLGFCLMAVDSAARNQSWRDRATEQLHKWNEEFEDVVHDIPSSERHQTPPASIYRPPSYPLNPRSPYLFRTRPHKVQSETDANLPSGSGTSSEESGESQQGLSHADTPSRPSVSGTKRKRTSDQHGQSTQPEGEQQHPPSTFCTQKCLLGLRHRDLLDKTCPNLQAHRCGTTLNRHRLNIASFRRLLEEQLSQDMDHNCEPMLKQGARGALFRITLASHGYVFVGKGTVEAFLPDLRHEGQIYKLLRRVQGLATPVHLGNIDLKRTYYLEVGVRIIHMLLMSCGGTTLADNTPPISRDRLEREIRQSTGEIRDLGVEHKDLRPQNMLWNVEVGRVLLIDFERSGVSRSSSHHRKRSPDMAVLRELSPNKKRRRLINDKLNMG
jgi:hypothetical protein